MALHPIRDKLIRDILLRANPDPQAAMPQSVTHKLIASHLLDGEMKPGKEIALRVDQTLTQDATGTLVMLELEAMAVQRVATVLSVQYVDHNLLQEDYKNPDDHLFLRSACQRFGVWYSGPGNGVSHPVHQERFGKPGATLLGSDSHTCAAGAIGMLAIGAGGIEVALAMAGEPFFTTMPQVWGVRLVGELPDWVSAKDVILEMLRRHSVQGGRGRIIEYYGPGLNCLSAMDRHVIANMGAELGATTTVFPSDQITREFLATQQREQDWQELVTDENAHYDLDEEINLSNLEPLIAMPSSPDNVRPVRDVAGQSIYQAYVGSSANPGYRDFAVAAEMVKHRPVAPGISFDINPTSRQILEKLTRHGHLQSLIHAGGRIHQAGCNGCIGMGQAPATDRLSLRTVPRNFPGRSGTPEDKVCLVSPETATASAMRGEISDPRELKIAYPRVTEPTDPVVNTSMLQPPLSANQARQVELVKGPNIVTLPDLEPIADELELKVLLKIGDDLSTDEILPAGARILPLRSNIPEISKHAFYHVDGSYYERAIDVRHSGGHAIVAGHNYGQGSSREHAALAPRYLGLHAVVAKSFARIHWQNLVNFGVLPLELVDVSDYSLLERNSLLRIRGLRGQLSTGDFIEVQLPSLSRTVHTCHRLSPRQRRILLAGGIINAIRQSQSAS